MIITADIDEMIINAILQIDYIIARAVVIGRAALVVFAIVGGSVLAGLYAKRREEGE